MESTNKLKRGLSTRHIRFMALGSAIGTGLFYGSADAIKMAGPSVLLAYIIGGAAAYIIMRALGEYLEKRMCLKGLVVLMDIRHPLKDLDQQMIDWAVASDIAVLVLLTKADKLASGARKAQVNKVREAVLAFNGDVQVEPFSSLKKQGVDKLRQKLDSWFNDLEPATEAEAE